MLLRIVQITLKRIVTLSFLVMDLVLLDLYTFHLFEFIGFLLFLDALLRRPVLFALLYPEVYLLLIFFSLLFCRLGFRWFGYL